MDLISIPSPVIQVIIFSLFISLVVYATRLMVEFYPPILLNKKINHFWTELFLPTYPIIIGGLVGGFVTSYPYPEIFVNGLAGRIFFGACCGFISGWIYRIVKNYFLKLSGNSENLTDEKSKE